MEDKLTFGKHKGKTFSEILDEDYSYILFLHDKNIVDIPNEIYTEARMIDDADGGYDDLYLDYNDLK